MMLKNLPAGVKFTFNTGYHNDHIYMKIANNEILIIKQGQRYPYFSFKPLPQLNYEITILEWPEHCGPRPIREVEVPVGMKYRHEGFIYTAIRLGLPNSADVIPARLDGYNFCNANLSRGDDYVTLVEDEVS